MAPPSPAPATEPEADAAMQHAAKLTTPTMLRWKPDWAGAVSYFEGAAACYKRLKRWDKGMGAMERCAVAQEAAGSVWHAGKALEGAAVCAKELGRLPQCVEMYRGAFAKFVESGRPEAAADALARAASALDDTGDSAGAAALYVEAVEYLEGEGRGATTGDKARSAVSCFCRAGRPADAVPVLLRLAANLDAAGASGAVCKAYLGAVVCALASGDARGADATLGDVSGVPAFSNATERHAADALLGAYRDGDAAEIQHVVKTNVCFGNLDASVARIAKKLPAAGTDLAGMSRALGGGAATAAAATKPALAQVDDDEDLL